MQSPTQLQLLVYRRVIEHFVEFTDEEWEIFCKHLYIKTIKKKEFFIESGKTCDEVGFILRGSVRYYHVKDGEEITGYFSIENDFVSAYKSFLTQQPALPYIEALEKTQLLIFNKNSLQELLSDSRINYKMERFGRLIAEATICCYEDRVVSFVTLSPEERYLHLLENGGNILNRIPQHYIANYLGITPVSLSRIRKRIVKGQLDTKSVAS